MAAVESLWERRDGPAGGRADTEEKRTVVFEEVNIGTRKCPGLVLKSIFKQNHVLNYCFVRRATHCVGQCQRLRARAF